MAEQVVAADASPLIGLASAGAFDLLRELFAKVIVTDAVRDEVRQGRDLPGAKELEAGIAQGWIEVVRTPKDLDIYPELGAGEASTLLMAREQGSDTLVLTDETLGRARARALGLPVTGLVGVLLAAKQAGLIEVVRPFLERLLRADFRISDQLVDAVLEEAGES